MVLTHLTIESWNPSGRHWQMVTQAQPQIFVNELDQGFLMATFGIT
jgi:hypothetical protein